MSHASEMLERYVEAELSILNGQSIDFGGRRLTLADLGTVQKGRAEWERRVAAERGGRRGAVASFSGSCGGEGRERHWGRT